MSKKTVKQSLSCGSCSGLLRDKLVSGNNTNCAGQGKIASARICPSYKADAFALAPVNDKAFGVQDPLTMLANATLGFSVTELQVVAALFLGEKKTRQQGFHFWQKVYIRISGSSSSNYLNNFVVGRVLDADREFVRVVSENGKSCIQVVNDKSSSTLYTIERFKLLRKEMFDAKAFNDPATDRILKKVANSGVIAPLDFAVEAGLVENEFKRGGKVRKSQNNDLVSIVRKMSSGRILKRRESSYDDGEISISHI